LASENWWFNPSDTIETMFENLKSDMKNKSTNKKHIVDSIYMFVDGQDDCGYLMLLHTDCGLLYMDMHTSFTKDVIIPSGHYIAVYDIEDEYQYSVEELKIMLLQMNDKLEHNITNDVFIANVYGEMCNICDDIIEIIRSSDKLCDYPLILSNDVDIKMIDTSSVYSIEVNTMYNLLHNTYDKKVKTHKTTKTAVKDNRIINKHSDVNIIDENI